MIAEKSKTRNYDLFKGAVALALVIIIVLLLLQRQGGTLAERELTAEAPTIEAPTAALPAAEVATGEPSTAVVPTIEPTPAPTMVPTAEPTALDWALPSLNVPQLAADGTLSLSGTGEPGATVELWAGDVKLGSVPVGADGAWSWEGELDPGDYALTARTVDAAGETLNESAALAVTVEAAAEVAAPTMAEPQISAQGVITLTGTAEPGTTVEAVADGVVVGTALVGEDGSWTLVYQVEAGAHELMVRDQATPERVSASLSVEVPAPTPVVAEAGSPEPSGEGEGEGYVVQPGDSLSALAARFYGNGQLWRLIYDATNAKAAEDPTFQAIDNPNFIRPSWKLWIPAQ